MALRPVGIGTEIRCNSQIGKSKIDFSAGSAIGWLWKPIKAVISAEQSKQEVSLMFSAQHLSYSLVVATLILSLDARMKPVLAIDAAVAKQCNALLAKNFPPRMAGNPAAGSAKGDAKQQRAYFKTCVEKNGKIDETMYHSVQFRNV